MPAEEVRRANGYLANANRDRGTFFYIITGCGVKHQRDLNQRFSGRMTLRAALVCRYLGYVILLHNINYSSLLRVIDLLICLESSITLISIMDVCLLT